MKVIMISHASCRVCSLNDQATFWVLIIKPENVWNEINVFTFVYLQNQNNENNPDPRIRVIFSTPKGQYCSFSVTHNKRTQLKDFLQTFRWIEYTKQQRGKLKIFSVASVPDGKSLSVSLVSFNEKSLSVFAIEVWLQGWDLLGMKEFLEVIARTKKEIKQINSTH